MRAVLLILVLLAAAPAAAEVVVATRVIRADRVITPGDVTLRDGELPGAAARLDQAVGAEARVAIYPGRPVRLADLGPPALVERNQVVTLVYFRGTLRIRAEGRALGRGAAGDRIRVMNLSSRTSLTGEIRADGTITVSR